MANPPKSTSFSFGVAATSNNSNSQGNIFGSTSAAPASSTSNPFTNIASTARGPTFTHDTSVGQASSAFGGEAAPGTSLFSSANKPSTSGFKFSSLGSSNSSSGPGVSTAPTQNPVSQSPLSSAPFATFSGFSATNKSSGSSTVNLNQTKPIFGLSNAGNGGMFGKQNPTTTFTSQVEAATPTTKPSTGLFFASSTTPAGPPPNNGADSGGNSGPVSNLGKPLETKPDLFGSVGTSQSSAPDTKTTVAPSNIFGGVSQPSGSLFHKPSDSGTPTSGSQNATNLFSNTLSGSGTGLFGTSGAMNSSGRATFSTLNKPKVTENGNSFGVVSSTGAPNASQQAQNTSTSSFSSLSGVPSITQVSSASLPNESSTQNTTGPSNPFFSIGSTSQPASSNANASIAPSANSNIFGALGGKGATSVTSANSPLPTSNSLFNPSSQTKDKMPSSTGGLSTVGITGPQQTSTSPPKSSLLRGLGQSTPSGSAPQEPSRNMADTAGGLGNALGTSTAGPPPPAQSRLKNKSMDEIITRWASDLSTYQKEFQKQAEKVSVWDRMLVENSDKIQKLYGSTLEAERATTEVERQLTAVENDQTELEVWLDHYEKEVDQMMSTQIGQGETFQGPDQERERT